MGATDHLMAAEQCDKEAAKHEEMAAEASARNDTTRLCGDRVMSDQVTSGGERLIQVSPCWTAEGDTVSRHKAEADRLHLDAEMHRAHARQLLDAEAASCAQMPAEELTHTPFAHREDIANVAAELDGDHVVGARITFRTVPGLTGDWLRQAISCHQARAAALGWDTTYMGYDPAVLPGVKAMVSEDDKGVVTVVLHAKDDGTALAVYGRAEDLLRW